MTDTKRTLIEEGTELKGTLTSNDEVVIGSGNAAVKPQATTAPGLSPTPTRMGGGRGGR